MPNIARTATISISRHRGASAIAVATLGFMLTALTVFVLLASGLGAAATGLASKAQLTTYLNSNVNRRQAANLESQIMHAWPRARIQYVSAAQALSQFRQTSYGRDLGPAIEGNPLPASLRIKTPNPLTLNQISSRVASDRRVHNVVLNRDLTDKLAEIATLVTIGGTTLVLGLGFLALVIVVNTTHLSVEARRQEIEVMRLIGATQAFVRNPLIVEGVLLGLAGAIVASVVGMGVFLPVVTWMAAGSSTLAELLPVNSSLAFLGALGAAVILVGAGIGALGSYVSVRRFARV